MRFFRLVLTNVTDALRILTFEVALLHHGYRRTYEADAVDSLGAAKLALWSFAPSGRYDVTVTCEETGSSEEFTVDRPNTPPPWEESG
jgi:hypothetical protein